MKRLTIIKEDNIIGVDGEFYSVNCSSLPVNFHALQWYGEAEEPYAEVEWNGNPKPENEFINNLNEYQSLIDAWGVAKEEASQPVVDPTEQSTP